MEYHVFYSWQSDLDEETNRKFILKAIEKAASNLKTKKKIEVYIDQATRDTSGAIDIAETIEQKVKQCDIFIGDVSIINKRSKFRKTPNPNVIFELGLACEVVGWNNIILINNESYGKYESLPFDIKTRRGIGYFVSNDSKELEKKIEELKNDLYKAILNIIKKEPKLRLKEITKNLKKSKWEAFNFTNGKINKSECKGIVTINHYHNNIFSFDFESYEGNKRFINGDWKARFFINESTLTTADLAFRSGIDFGFKRIMFPLDRNYDHLYIIGTPPIYGNQVLIKK